MNNSKEKEVQMIRKPIYAATGLLNYLDEIQAKLDINGKYLMKCIYIYIYTNYFSYNSF